MIYGNMKEHKCEVEGIKPQIMTEVSTLLHICYEKGLFNKDDLNKIAEMACRSNDDLHKEAMNKLEQIENIVDAYITDNPREPMYDTEDYMESIKGVLEE